MSTASTTQLASPPADLLSTPAEVLVDAPHHQFDLKTVRDAFVTCVQPDNTLLLGEYVRAYEELCV